MNDASRLTELEIQIAHQARMLEEMSDVIHTQGKDIERLKAHLRLLLEQAAAADDAAPQANVKPPHY